MNRRIAIYDFDGTLIGRDTFFYFARYARGWWRLMGALIINAPYIIAHKLRLYSGDKAKERLFSTLFRGMSEEEFTAKGAEFADVIECHAQLEILATVNEYDRAYIATGSIYQWVAPWARRHGIERVIATEVETDSFGRLTGRFKSKNCIDKEKIERLKQIDESIFDGNHICVYSDNDAPLFEIATEAHKVECRWLIMKSLVD